MTSAESHSCPDHNIWWQKPTVTGHADSFIVSQGDCCSEADLTWISQVLFHKTPWKDLIISKMYRVNIFS